GLRGYYFFTRLLERKALIGGALLATRLGDIAAADWYLDQAKQLGKTLSRHWNSERKYIVAGFDEIGKIINKRSGLDSSVVLATLSGYSPEEEHSENLFSVNDEQVMATEAKLEQIFEKLYPINDPARGIPGIAIGRYPEDTYDGYHSDALGNPWP